MSFCLNSNKSRSVVAEKKLPQEFFSKLSEIFGLEVNVNKNSSFDIIESMFI